MRGEVAQEVGPAELPLGRVDVVVAAPAVGADDPGEAFAEQRPGLERVPAGRDPSQAPRTIPATESALATSPFFQPMKAVSAMNPSAMKSTLLTDSAGYSLNWRALGA